jgi:hypothetical protein
MKKHLSVLLILFLVIIFGILINRSGNFSALETDRNKTRQEYLGNGLGRIYKNRIGLYYFNNVYPKTMKFEISLFTFFNKPYIYISIFGVLAYFGLKKYAEE